MLTNQSNFPFEPCFRHCPKAKTIAAGQQLPDKIADSLAFIRARTLISNAETNTAWRRQVQSGITKHSPRKGVRDPLGLGGLAHEAGRPESFF